MTTPQLLSASMSAAERGEDLQSEAKIHLDARQHSLAACSLWLLQWERACGTDHLHAQFCLQRALASAHAAEDSMAEANGGNL